MTLRYRRRAGLTVRAIGSSVFVAHRGRGTVCRLNETGSALWRLLRRPMTARDVVAVFCDAFPDEPRSDVEQRVVDLLHTLVADDHLVAQRVQRRDRKPVGRRRKRRGVAVRS